MCENFKGTFKSSNTLNKHRIKMREQNGTCPICLNKQINNYLIVYLLIQALVELVNTAIVYFIR